MKKKIRKLLLAADETVCELQNIRVEALNKALKKFDIEKVRKEHERKEYARRIGKEQKKTDKKLG